MHHQPRVIERKSAERLAFEYFLRTGRLLPPQASSRAVEQKFNPYHDPRDGRFTFAPGGPRSLSHVIISERRDLYRGQQRGSRTLATVAAGATPAPIGQTRTASISDAVYRPGDASATIQPAQYRPNPRVRVGGNGGPPLNDPLTLERTFPALANAPGGSLVALAEIVSREVV
jgi:hypothetical protein